MRRAIVLAALFALVLASCGGSSEETGSTDAPVTDPESIPRVSETPAVDPGIDEIEVSGELLAQSTGDGKCTERGDMSRCVGAPWEGDYSMSDPRLSGHAEVSFNLEMGPAYLFRWWYTGVLRNDAGTWEGLNLGEKRVSDVHVGEGVWLGTGAYTGLEFHEHTYLGPGAETSQADRFEVTGSVHSLATEGWEFDPAFTGEGVRMAVRSATEAWDAADSGAAVSLYARDATFLNTDGSTTVGRTEIATLVENSAKVGFRIELLPPVLVNGNYAAAAFHWTTDENEGWMLGVFRFDEAGLISQHEVIAA